VNNLGGALRTTIEFCFWTALAAFFSLAIAAGNFILVALIVSALALLLIIMAGPQFIVGVWLFGSPTIFPIANQVLSALPFITMERLMFGLVIALLAIKGVFCRGKRSAIISLEVAMACFLIYAALSLFGATSKASFSRDVWFLLQYAIPMFMFMVGRRMEWSERQVKKLLFVFTVVGVLLALVGILQGLLGVDWFTTENQSVTAGHKDRAHGAFSNAHTYIATLFIFLAMSVMQFGMCKDALLRTVLVFAMALMALGIVLGQTRAAWCGAGLGMMIIMIRDSSVRPLIVTGAGIGVMAGVAIMFLMIDQLGFLIDRMTNITTMASRLVTWATAINIISDYPVFGVGFGAEAFLDIKRYYLTGFMGLPQQYALYLQVPHNEYLHVTVLLGLLGLAMFMFILVNLLVRLFRVSNDINLPEFQRKLALYTAASILGLMLNSLFSDTFVQDYYWMLGFFLAGLSIGMAERVKENSFTVTNELFRER